MRLYIALASGVAGYTLAVIFYTPRGLPDNALLWCMAGVLVGLASKDIMEALIAAFLTPLTWYGVTLLTHTILAGTSHSLNPATFMTILLASAIQALFATPMVVVSALATQSIKSRKGGGS